MSVSPSTVADVVFAVLTVIVNVAVWRDAKSRKD